MLAPENSRHQSGLQGDFTGLTFPSGEVPCAQPGHVATQEQGSNKQEGSQQRDLAHKKEMDKERKSRERSVNSQIYAEICRRLQIPLKPKNTLPERSEHFCIYPVSDIEHSQFWIVLTRCWKSEKGTGTSGIISE